MNQNYFWKKDKRGKAVIGKEKRKLLNNANEKYRKLNQKIEKAKEIANKWKKKDRSKWKDSYLLENNKSRKELIYKKVRNEYNAKVLRRRPLIMVNKNLDDVRMIYDTVGRTLLFRGRM